jgi:hypothetical protein
MRNKPIETMGDLKVISGKPRNKRTISVKDLRVILTSHKLAHLTNGDVALIVGLAEAYIDDVNLKRAYRPHCTHDDCDICAYDEVSL